MAGTDPPTNSAASAADRAPSTAFGPTPNQLRAEAPLLIGMVVTALLVAVFLGGALFVAFHYLTTVQPPPPV